MESSGTKWFVTKEEKVVQGFHVSWKVLEFLKNDLGPGSPANLS